MGVESCTPFPLLSSFFLLFLTSPPSILWISIVSYDIENERRKREKESSRMEPSLISNEFKRETPSSLWFLVRDLVGLGSLSCGGNRKTLEAGYFHGRDGHNIDAAEISCGSRPPPISTTTIIESGVYRRKSSILSIIPPLHLSYFDRLNRF